MRFLVRRTQAHYIQAELQAVQAVMVSGYLVLADLFFYALLFTLLLSPVLPSVFMAVLLFIILYGSCGALYFYLKKWLVRPD
ncbi:hypothetical protein CU633_11865 [Bacillus sp. V3-13]|uniref:hypothetical protein n=1 Tax=Bacillus sp. V3-13 TaxID=2053728 RepID=UPI000C75B6CA|nr:hypothetical protein [Bacillus sp. V3-13]PLR77233.1 hypothetical protein CU633_11865 [Bacillus sp. V3-13]